MSRPSENEEEFILRQEMAKRRDAAHTHQAELAEGERERLKELHWMRCGKCGAELQEVEYRGVKIDKCFSCGGVFLDDGELEQLAGRPGWFDSMLKVLKT